MVLYIKQKSNAAICIFQMASIGVSGEANLRRLHAGQKLAGVPTGEKLVISGIAGKFPNSHNVAHFMENLLNKVDLCDDDESRWSHINDEIPRLSGKLYNIDKFDCGYFGVPELQANWMDPMCRLTLESVTEALVDAGIHPDELKGTNTGVYIGSCHSESEKHHFYTNLQPQTFPVLGCTRSMQAHRISYALQLNGPSIICDTACSSGLYAFECAYRAILEGKCDMAIVVGSALCMDPYITLQFARLGVLNMNTGCRPFDADASGYTRSEGNAVLILQKEKHARRIYAQIVHSKVNSDGFKEQGITYPSADDQLQLYRDIYEECGVDPSSVAYVEAHGTGTKVGDPEELSAIDKFFCANRERPLLIGSVKGNIGHSEPVSGICSLIKVIFGMSFDYIPPNIHFDTPRPDIPSLVENRLVVLTEKTKWPEFSPLGGVNSFGFGGANCHVLMERPRKLKNINHDETPRLVCFSGRTEEGVQKIQDHLRDNELDYEFLRLIQEVYSKHFKNHQYRGYSILSSNAEIKRTINPHCEKKRSIYLCLGNENVHSCSSLQELKKLIPFKETFDGCVNILQKNNVNIQLKEDDPNNILQKVVLTVVVHLGLIDIFKAINIPFDYIRGLSMGEFTAAYANGALKMEEVIMSTYTISKHFLESPKSDTIAFQKLLIKLNSTIKAKNIKTNKIQSSKSNNFPYGSSEYFLFNILNPTLVSESQPKFEQDAIVVNVDQKCSSKESVTHVELIKGEVDVVHVLSCVGRLYDLGYNPSIHKLFPEIKWPVSRGTPMLSPLWKWNHTQKFFIPRKRSNFLKKVNEKVCRFNVMGSELSFYKGHVIDGRNLFPATGYIVLVWQLLSEIVGEPHENIRVCFENVKFLRATTFSRDGVLFVIILHKDGLFEIVENNTPIATGTVYLIDKFEDPTKQKANLEGVTLTQKDIYKELRLRGYHYKGAFKAVHQIKGDQGLIHWNGNWIPFLDNMLQLYIITEDTRSLVVPTGIDSLVIDPKVFLEYTETLGDDKLVPCYVNKVTNSIYTKYIEMIGLRATAISRKRQVGQPVLETYKFVPNTLSTNIEVSIRINMQILLENKAVIDMKILEAVNDDSDTLQPLSPKIVTVLEDLPLIQPEILLFAKKELAVNMKGIQLETEKVIYEHNNILYIGSNLLNDEKALYLASAALLEDGFFLTIERTECSVNIPNFTVLTTHHINNKVVYLLKRSRSSPAPSVINVTHMDKLEKWLEDLKTNFKNTSRVLLYAQNDPVNGILGLINCIRREPTGEKVSGFFIKDDAPSFDVNHTFYKDQVDKGMGINVYQNGQWGTYRHLLCHSNSRIKSDHFYGNTITRGDLSSLDWFEGSLTPKDDNVQQIYYASLNFRDVMLASGKLPVDSVVSDRKLQDCVQGFEFSGRDKEGNRIMGISQCGSTSNLVRTRVVWKVPEEWSLEDAATVPVVYLTVLQAFQLAGLKRGQSVLIHSGTGGIGQAAINVCSYYDCNIFTTVGTGEKKKFLQKHFPQVKYNHIGCSRNTTFEEMIFRETNGRGVDIVLNSLAEEKLHASVRCLAKGGYFLEIGKYDLTNDTRLSAELVSKGATYHGVMLDFKFRETLWKFFESMLGQPYIKPLIRTCFQMDQLESAFRFMTSGKHIGKVLIKIRDEEKGPVQCPSKITYPSIPRFYCDPTKAYLIIGGLGGFGLELGDWLMIRGAKTLIMSSRNGVQTGYQAERIRNWKENGTQTIVLLDDVTTHDGCKKLITKANTVAPVAAIFNLAVELKDALLENQTYPDFQASLRPKAFATMHLDKLSRTLCPDLKQFVIFSSVSCGRGNAGQTNYGMSNSIMERICEQRRVAGYPALAVQWGAVGDVGLVAEMQKEATEIAIGGTLQQRITSCLDVLDKFLKQNEVIVSSIVVAEKFGSRNSDNLVDAVLNIIGLVDLKTVSIHSTLSELGMDSMMAIEIKQTLERDYDVFLSAQDMRILTFARLLDINESRVSALSSVEDNNLDISKYLILNLYDKTNYQNPTVEMVSNKDTTRKVLLFPGIEGSYMSLKSLMENLKYSCVCIQYKLSNDQKEIEDVVNYYYPIVKESIGDTKIFNFVAHSFGGVIALEMVSRLEKEGYKGSVVLLDSSPDFMIQMTALFSETLDETFEINLLLKLIETYTSAQELPLIAGKLKKAKSFEERKQIAVETLPNDKKAPKDYLHTTGKSAFSLIISLAKYQFSPEKKLSSKVDLCKPSVSVLKEQPEDYHLSKYCENVRTSTFSGNHLTILDNSDVCAHIHQIFE